MWETIYKRLPSSTEDLIVILRFLFPIMIIFYSILWNMWMDFHEIVRVGVYCSGIENVEPDF